MWHKYSQVLSQKLIVAVLVSGAFACIGIWTLASSHAATPATNVEAEAGVVTGNASLITDATASDGAAIKFTSTTTTATCPNGANTPGGSDPWGGCWPGDYNTGYPHGLAGDTRTPVALTAYTGSCSITVDGTIIDKKSINNCSNDGLFIYAKNVVIKNSLVNTEVYENSDSASVTLMDTEVNGGNQYTFPTIGGANNVTAIRVNSHNGEHTIQCYSNCDVEDSWLHDQFDAGPGPHQNGFLSNGGSVFTIRHNSVDCHSSGCTAGITFIPDDNVSKAVVDKNLLIAGLGAGYCMDVSSNHPAKSGVVTQMTVTNNIFQRGSNNKCAVYGPVGGWDQPTSTPGSDGYLNVWNGNRWTDGTAINP